MNSQTSNAHNTATTWCLRISAVLWVIWGVVHMLAGALTIQQDTAGAIAGIADAVDPETLKMTYADAAGGLVNQHGFNLLWIGAVTTICAAFIWRHSRHAIFLAALVGGLTDLGYFLFMDLGGFVHFVPGTLMTLICLAAIVISMIGLSRMRPLPNTGG